MSNQKQTDLNLLSMIEERLRWDIRVSASDVCVKVRNGAVTLYGYFDHSYRKNAAISVITSTQGVKEIDDKSQVLEDYHRDDTDLEHLIEKQIKTLPFVRGEWIRVHVENGVARLEGAVFRARFKAFVARASWELSGIADCLNLVQICEYSGTLPALKSVSERQTALSV